MGTHTVTGQTGGTLSVASAASSSFRPISSNQSLKEARGTYEFPSRCSATRACRITVALSQCRAGRRGPSGLPGPCRAVLAFVDPVTHHGLSIQRIRSTSACAAAVPALGYEREAKPSVQQIREKHRSEQHSDGIDFVHAPFINNSFHPNPPRTIHGE